jgi:RNA polymerase sigma-70 factor (ECF subfamily)
LKERAADREREEDELLAIRCQLGEPAAFDDLIDRWHLPLWKYVRRVTGDDDQAAEALQDTWLRVLRGFPRLREPSRIRAWLFGIARRVLMDRLRREYQRPPQEPLSTLEDAFVGEQLEELPAFEPLLNEVAQLPVIEREVIVLFYMEDLTLAEIAEVLGVPDGTVKSRLFRARRLLRLQLQKRGYSSDEL